MEELKLGTVESKFADIIWENEPISSGQLVKLCGQQLDWKKSTTYTMLKRLCERGFLNNFFALCCPKFFFCHKCRHHSLFILK